ncbi:MAG: hypothetical protein ACR2PG_15840, partial [Hyphomicrobiaceae bacterium]
MIDYDRTEEDVGNILALEHVNTCVPDQQIALSFYVNGLGLTRDPYLMTGSKNMWINVGTSQFHLPTRRLQVLRGHTGIVMPDRGALLARLAEVRSALSETQFSFAEEHDYVDVTCPWGNRMRCYEPRAEFGKMQLGIAYVELNVPIGSAHGIAEFYDKVLGAKAVLGEESGAPVACVTAGINQVLRFRETEEAQNPFDGH